MRQRSISWFLLSEATSVEIQFNLIKPLINQLSWGGFGLSWGGGFRALVGGLGFCGEGFGLSWRGFGLSQEKIRAFVGRDSGFRAASGFRGEDLGFRGDLVFRGGSSFRGEGFGLSNRYYESKA